jgi:hypothetical protein
MAREGFDIKVRSMLTVLREIVKKKPGIALQEARSITDPPAEIFTAKQLLRMAEEDAAKGTGEKYELVTEPVYYWGEDAMGVHISRFSQPSYVVLREAPLKVR